MSGSHGVENTIKMVQLIAEAGNVAEDVAKAKGGLLGKIGLVSDLFDEIMALTSVNWGELKNELGELDDEDMAQVTAALKEKLDLDNDLLEDKIEKGVELLVAGKDFVEDVIAFSKSLKEKPEAPAEPSA